ncbi:hypothetical protein ZIOFF_008209 [Zingiber officinale]|uniref:Uncharacterized protein n=1 Tax=Zingiber officinale TaxID=94328 RepID=A0A8J5HVU5_ZINOF|nr:hypothetical protein ZIOFF_008209 [Zingiber officinale]
MSGNGAALPSAVALEEVAKAREDRRHNRSKCSSLLLGQSTTKLDESSGYIAFSSIAVNCDTTFRCDPH